MPVKNLVPLLYEALKQAGVSIRSGKYVLPMPSANREDWEFFIQEAERCSLTRPEAAYAIRMLSNQGYATCTTRSWFLPVIKPDVVIEPDPRPRENRALMVLTEPAPEPDKPKPEGNVGRGSRPGPNSARFNRFT